MAKEVTITITLINPSDDIADRLQEEIQDFLEEQCKDVDDFCVEVK